MHLILTTLMVGSFLSVIPAACFAQTSMPPQGYWVVETNAKTKDYSIVKFYNLEDQLIYEEYLKGVNLNVNRRKHVSTLNKMLQQVLDKSLIAAQVKRNSTTEASSLYKKRSQ